MPPVLSVRGLAKSYGSVQALAAIDLDVERGEIFGFLGPNGAGKTTFTKCVTGFIRPDAGAVQILGIDAIHHPTQVAPHVGLVPDQYDFYSNLTGRQHLEFYGRLLGMPAELRSARIEEVLGIVRMQERADTRVRGYSHGMKQRICIAQAILHKPELVLFDEPTNGLDPQGAYELRELIKAIARDGATVFLNSHLLTEVEQTCQRVAILDKGRLLAVGSVDELRRRAGSLQGTVLIRVLNPTDNLAQAAKSVLGYTPRLGSDSLEFQGDPTLTAQVVAALVKAGGQVVAVSSQSATLESAFLQLVGAPAVTA